LARNGHRLAEGLEAGADDCVRTPAGADELRARINVGRRFAALPWERVVQAATGGSHRAPEHVLHAVPELEAVRSLDDDELDDAGSAAGFQLKSVLVAR
jgi:DNA-binding response OmpR family regulator